MWEEPIKSGIQSVRKKERNNLLKLYCFRGMSIGILRNANIILSFPVILVPLLRGENLEASTIFAAISLIDSLSLFGIQYLNHGILVASEYISLFKRVQETLLL